MGRIKKGDSASRPDPWVKILMKAPDHLKPPLLRYTWALLGSWQMTSSSALKSPVGDIARK
ncbi:hypothetical protein [Metallosphaera javensis (ex Sakai et al. 2022)]|uniref:hypothetical protein n=1 Tax=Metallosphaera javensis (ex Sakai et al. 2022) TaxID=2775498 RepID=UPI002587846F|nr:MAG: hypothetical protein MjAS7_1897 [Metallosphaera javensis (ex Sakai et al. 2022)]